METKKYNTTLAAIYKRFDNDYGLVMHANIPTEGQYLQQFQDAVKTLEPGGRFVIKVLPANKKKTDKSPDGFLEYQDKASVDQDKAKAAAHNATKKQTFADAPF